MTVELSFESKRQGKGLDNYEMYVDLVGSTVATISLLPPDGWKIRGAQFYEATPAGRQNKSADMADLRNNKADQVCWESIFGNPWPESPLTIKTAADGTATIECSDPAAHVGEFEYLIWLRSNPATDPPTNDFIDPGIRNR